MSAKSVIFFSTVFMAYCTSLVNAQGDTPTRAPSKPPISTPGSSDDVLWGLNTLEVIFAVGVPSFVLFCCCAYCLFRRASRSTIDGLLREQKRAEQGERDMKGLFRQQEELSRRQVAYGSVETVHKDPFGNELIKFVDGKEMKPQSSYFRCCC